MEIIRGLHNLKHRHRGCVATIGNFDGGHRGHQEILTKLNEQAKRYSLPSLLITFEPQPKEFFLGDKAPPRLMSLREKIGFLQQKFSIDRMLCLRFDNKLASMSAQEFISEMLHKLLDVRYLLTGRDFRFGHNREGDFSLLMRAAQEYGFELETTASVNFQGRRISSTWIREALTEGDLELVGELLGRPYAMCGRVVHGDKRGRLLGFPTANINLNSRVSPIRGVYVVQVQGPSQQSWPGVANIGRRPTISGNQCILEVHLFNFERDIYRSFLQVDFLKKIRDEKRFESLPLLKEQIMQDAQLAQTFFDKRS